MLPAIVATPGILPGGRQIVHPAERKLSNFLDIFSPNKYFPVWFKRHFTPILSVFAKSLKRRAASAAKARHLSDIRLMYRSHNAMTVGGPRLYVHFHDIVTTARRRNAQAGIGGFLMFDRLRFHQILEGPEQSVDSLFARITRDNRHRDIECLSREPVSVRRFAQWSMGSFLQAGGDHPILRRHGLPPQTALDYEPFLRFALDFAQEHDTV